MIRTHKWHMHHGISETSEGEMIISSGGGGLGFDDPTILWGWSRLNHLSPYGRKKVKIE